MFPKRGRSRLMKLCCAKSSARMCKSSREKSASATCGITHSSMPLPISSKILFREPGCGPDETATRCADKRVTISRQKFPGNCVVREIIVIGAHYDSVFGSPGANDNGDRVAATLALARRFASAKPKHTLRFVAFVNEEPPYFLSGEMGSLVYARRCKERGDKISAMISLETIGYFSDAPHSQTYPSPGLGVFYPKVGNFIGFVSNVKSRPLLRRVIALFRKHAKIPSEGAALPAFIPGVSWSDQWSFWQQGYPAIMVTDTAPFRYPYYHSSNDTPDKLDYDRFTLVVSGMEKVIEKLTNLESGR